MNKSYLMSVSCACLFVTFSGVATFVNAATLTYIFGPVESSTGVIGSGTITFSAPPASASSGWTSVNDADVLDWTFTRISSFGELIISASDVAPSTGYVMDYNDPESLTGTELDAGLFSYDIPLIADEPNPTFIFSSIPGNDYVAIGGFTVAELGPGFYGDWTVVPVPAAVWLFGSGLIGLIGIGRRRNS